MAQHPKIALARTADYIAGGYFLSRACGSTDWTGTEIRNVSLATDHSPRKFFPESWCLSWCQNTEEERLKRASEFGITEGDLAEVVAWADGAFGKKFGVWSTFFTLSGAREAAHLHLSRAIDLELWGVGLHHTLVNSYCEATKPPEASPGHAPMGASGSHTTLCQLATPLAEGGTILGHEILVEGMASDFNSPESWHLDEAALFKEVGVVPNKSGLVDSLDEALAVSQHLQSQAVPEPYQRTGWMPWLLVRYSLQS